MAVEVTNNLSIAEYGTNSHLRAVALAPELGVPYAAMIWQSLVASGQRCATSQRVLHSNHGEAA